MAKRSSDGVWLPANSRYWYMDFRVGKKRFTGSTRCTSRKEAVAFAANARKKELSRLARTGLQAWRDMSLPVAFDKFMTQKGRHSSQAGTVENALNWILDQVGDHVTLTQVDDAMLAELIEAKRALTKERGPEGVHYSNQTVNQYITTLLRTVLGRAKRVWKIPLPDEPCWKEHILPVKPRTRELSLAEEDALIAAAGDLGYRQMFRFMLLSGVRKSNGPIRWDQVDMALGVIRLIQKGGNPHEVEITESIADLLAEAAPGGKRKHPVYVFTRSARPDGKADERGVTHMPITVSGLTGAFKRTVKAAQLQDVRVHDLRRTAGARLYRRYGCLARVQMFLGHANMSMTRKHYVHMRTEHIRSTVHEADAYYAGLRREREAAAA